ncbi:MAG: hypothetical protein C0P74_004035 [Gammaproteobacteria bacterium]|nr:hypothetical protein [Gammaproteobacteria bacterium]
MARAKSKTRSTAGRGARKKVATRSSNARAAKAAKTAKKTSVKKKTARASSGRQNRWTPQEDRTLRTMVKQGYAIRDIVATLGRTESAVRQHVYKLGLTLRGRKRRR